MNKRFTYLVAKYLDSELNKKEKAEFDKFLLDPECSEYLKKAEKAEKLIEEGFRLMNEREEKRAAAAAAAGKNNNVNLELYEIEEQVKRDIIKYGGKKNPETVALVKQMHQNMLKRRRNIRRLIFGSVAAVILIGIAIIYLLTSMTSP